MAADGSITVEKDRKMLVAMAEGMSGIALQHESSEEST